MLGIKFYKADSSTFVIKSAGGKVHRKGKGLSFFYNLATTSIVSVPINVQEAPFIFGLQTSDYQEVRIQGQVSYRIDNPEKVVDVLNFNLTRNGQGYTSEDPLKLSDRVVRAAQTMIQGQVEEVSLRESLLLTQPLVKIIKEQLGNETAIGSLGIVVVDASISSITPSPETVRALEAETRETILKEADDAIYLRRKAAVEQERTIKEAELETELSVQQKEQEIEESRIANERAVLRGESETEQERIQAQIDAEARRKELVILNAENSKQNANAEAYAIESRMTAFKALPVENLKAMVLANMQPEQLMAMAFESLAQNAGKIGELNITPDLFGKLMKRSIVK